MSLACPLAALLALLITLQLLLKAKSKVVVSMTNNSTKSFVFECLADVSGHMASVCGSALVTAAMAP
ncbi:hypothetical protein GGGNBK_21260 [Sporosarcina sp. ANT_H38]